MADGEMMDAVAEPADDELGAKVMVFSTAEYPQLEGLAAGASVPKITHTGNKVREANEGSVTVEMGQCEFEVENQADKALKETTGAAPAAGSDRKNADFATEY
jgi:hypothetical protein